MATSATAKPTAPPATQSAISPTMCLIAGWLIPGAGHFLLRKPVRGALLFFAVTGMFFTGIALDAKIYQLGGDLLDILGFAGQLGNGLLLACAHIFDLGRPSIQTALADYGTKFIVIGGLLNVICAVDAHSLASGRKAS